MASLAREGPAKGSEPVHFDVSAYGVNVNPSNSITGPNPATLAGGVTGR